MKIKRLTVQLFIDIDEDTTNINDVLFHLDTAIDSTIKGVVKRTDLIDVIDG